MSENVLEAARRRLRVVFEHFARVVVSVSGGKDSQVLWHLALQEARGRGRQLEVFFLDQEAEYAGSIGVVEEEMVAEGVVPRWYQVPLRMTNAGSYRHVWLHAWGPGEQWLRPKHPLAIHEAPGAPDRFYDFFPWYERQGEAAAYLVGLRSRESPHRSRAMRETAPAGPGPRPAYNKRAKTNFRGIGWSTAAAQLGSYRFYPLFDWGAGDVWKYLADAGLRYNPVYDRLYALRGSNERTMRVSFLVHEQSYRSLATLQELEPETYEALVRRLGGVHQLGLYAEEPIMGARVLPQAFGTWRAFRDHLLATTPLAPEYMAKVRKRLLKQGDDEAVCREQCRQLLANDWENNVPVRRTPAVRLREAWWDKL